MFLKDNNRLDKELNMTDLYLNKMLPIAQFTQTMTTLRTVMDDEDQLEKLKKIQEKFFNELDPRTKEPEDDITEYSPLSPG